MPDISTTPIWAWPTGAAALFFAIKYLWPLMKQSLDTQLAQGRTESGLLAQALSERDKALARADAADDRADELFKQLADVQAQLKIMAFQLEVANSKIEALTAKLNELTGGQHA